MKTDFQNLFPSLDICKQFQEKGFFQESNFVYNTAYNEPKVEQRKKEFQNPYFPPAPTTDEILAELCKDQSTLMEINHYVLTGEWWKVYFSDILDRKLTIENESLPEALAELFLKLKADNII